jgi:glycosyltransferase involved in cell wall biosynthesis
MSVVYLSCHHDRQRRRPNELLAAWPTLVDVPVAVRRAGVEVRVIQAAHEDTVIERDGVRFQFVRTAGRAWPWRLLRAVTSARPAIVHSQGLAFPLQLRALGLRMPEVPVLVQDHGGRPPHGWRRYLVRWGLDRVRGVAFTARAQAEPFRAAGVLPPHVPVFEVLESSSHFLPGDTRAARDVTGLHGDPCLLWVGRLDHNKDPLTVLSALSQALPRLRDPQLWCYYTSAPLLGRVHQRLRDDAALARRVHLMGAVPHTALEQLYRAADLFVLASHREGSGYALLESLACGMTPLVTDIPSFRRITGEGAVGALFPPEDAAALSRLLVAWSERDRARLRQSARHHFESQLSFRALGEELRSTYEALGSA